MQQDANRGNPAVLEELYMFFLKDRVKRQKLQEIMYCKSCFIFSTLDSRDASGLKTAFYMLKEPYAQAEASKQWDL